jgi:serine/threonine-protein kinase SRPK3
MNGDYDTSADMWSLACMVFELITGDYLFDPKKGKNKSYSKNDDHLALVTELIGPCKDKEFIFACEDGDKFYDKTLELKRIKKLKFWGLKDVLIQKYRMYELEAIALADFLSKMLKWRP